MAKQKQVSDVLGFKNRCVNFQSCPICYGCRNYRSDVPDCKQCEANAKLNICDTKRHRTDLIHRMVLRPRFKVNKIEFK